MICINGDMLGTKLNLVQHHPNGHVEWSNKRSDLDWSLGMSDAALSLEGVFSLFGTVVPYVAPSRYINMVNNLFTGCLSVPWHLVLPENLYKDRLNRLLNSAWDVLEALNDSGYHDTFIDIMKFLSELSKSKISVDRLRYHRGNEKNATILSTLASFTPDVDGYLNTPVYDPVKTSTGRLLISSGPRILTLPTRCRDIIIPSSDDTEIIQVDFVSLEPRVALLLGLNNSTSPEDIYSDLAKNVFGGSLTRAQAKTATLCALYGISNKKLASIVSGVDAVHVIKRVRDYFDVPDNVKRLKATLNDQGFLQNFFGRPLLFDDDKKDHILYSHYIQSTAADLAILGFRQLLDTMFKNTIGYRCLFLIHDAMILEVDKQYVTEIEKMSKKGIMIDKIGNFPLEVKKMATIENM